MSTPSQAKPLNANVADSSQRTSPRSPIEVQGLSVGYQIRNKTHVAVRDISFVVGHREKVILLGPSGCGKSTILKCIGGFIAPLNGVVRVNGHEQTEPGPDRAMVFQEFDQLFPWKTVFDNVAYPLRVQGYGKDEAATRARRHLETTGLWEAADRYPHQLSGGMKQRVAIARALALEPLVLLMDEPFGSLDALTRARMQRELRQLADTVQVAIAFVTHSIIEAALLGDRVIVLTDTPGRIKAEVDVSAVRETDSEEFLAARRQLGSLIGDASSDTSRAFE